MARNGLVGDTLLNKSKVGLSLLEVLVVLAIVALLAALVLPAVQMARDAARRASCANKLHQMGIALSSYLDSNKSFPPRMVFGIAPDSAIGGPWGPSVVLLPLLDGEVIYNQINLSLNWQDRSNTTVLYKSPEQYLCPADGGAPRTGYGVANYKPCIGSGRWPGAADALITPDEVKKFPAYPDGLFRVDGVRRGDVPDGLSHTAAVGEMVHGGDLAGRDWTELPLPSLGLTYHFMVVPRTQAAMIRKCENLDRPEGLALPSGVPWCSVEGYTHLFGPGKASCFGDVGDAFSPITASSGHRNGVNLVLADGHVRFVENHIDLEVWRALGSRNGKEQVDSRF
jgi:prepilin-type processing-associated H-X9-DG protein